MKKMALITGGTKGIGLQTAATLADNGYNLVLTYAADAHNADEVATQLRTRTGQDVHTLQADISASTSVDKIINFANEHDLRFDAVVLNANLTYRASFEDIAPEEWEKVFFANVHFPVFLLQRLLTRINPNGCVVFTGSLMGIEPHATSLAYGVTKAAIHALTKNLVKFLSPYQIRVNAVAPGFVDTDWQRNKPAAIRHNIEQKLSTGRFCRPDELGNIYLMLIENTYFDGEIIVVSGGYSYK